MKKILSISLMAGLALAGLTSCDPQEKDEYSLNGTIPSAVTYANNFSVSVNQETNYATFSFASAPGVVPVWEFDESTYNSGSNSSSVQKYFRKRGTYTVRCKVMSPAGLSTDYVEQSFTINETKIGGFPGFVYNGQYNMLKDYKLSNPGIYYGNDDWSARSDYEKSYDEAKNTMTVTFPGATSERWKAQVAFETGVAISAGKKYDFSAILYSPVDLPSKVKVKVCQADNDNVVLVDKDFAVKADEPVALWGAELEGQDMSNVKVLFDFGGNPDNTVVKISNLVLKDNANSDGTEVPKANEPFDYKAANNVWRTEIDEKNAFTESTWFGDANWADMGVTVADLKTSHEGSVYKLTIPKDTPNERWHAQYALNTNLTAAADDVIDFSLKVTASNSIPKMTVKLTEADEPDAKHDDNYYFDEQEPVSGEFVFRVEDAKLPKGAAHALNMVFDFGGTPAGTEITISEITVIKKK